MPSPDGLLIVDYSASGKPLGVEITAGGSVPLDRLNQLLAELGEPPLGAGLHAGSSRIGRHRSERSVSLAHRDQGLTVFVASMQRTV